MSDPCNCCRRACAIVKVIATGNWRRFPIKKRMSVEAFTQRPALRSRNYGLHLLLTTNSDHCETYCRY